MTSATTKKDQTINKKKTSVIQETIPADNMSVVAKPTHRTNNSISTTQASSPRMTTSVSQKDTTTHEHGQARKERRDQDTNEIQPLNTPAISTLDTYHGRQTEMAMTISIVSSDKPYTTTMQQHDDTNNHFPSGVQPRSPPTYATFTTIRATLTFGTHPHPR